MIFFSCVFLRPLIPSISIHLHSGAAPLQWSRAMWGSDCVWTKWTREAAANYELQSDMSPRYHKIAVFPRLNRYILRVLSPDEVVTDFSFLSCKLARYKIRDFIGGLKTTDRTQTYDADACIFIVRWILRSMFFSNLFTSLMMFREVVDENAEEGENKNNWWIQKDMTQIEYGRVGHFFSWKFDSKTSPIDWHHFYTQAKSSQWNLLLLGGFSTLAQRIKLYAHNTWVVDPLKKSLANGLLFVLNLIPRGKKSLLCIKFLAVFTS